MQPPPGIDKPRVVSAARVRGGAAPPSGGATPTPSPLGPTTPTWGQTKSLDNEEAVEGGWKALEGRASRPGTAGCPPLVAAGSSFGEEETEEMMTDPTDGVETGMEGDNEDETDNDGEAVLGFGALVDGKLGAAAGIKGILNRSPTRKVEKSPSHLTKARQMRSTGKRHASKSGTKKSSKKGGKARRSTDEEGEGEEARGKEEDEVDRLGAAGDGSVPGENMAEWVKDQPAENLAEWVKREGAREPTPPAEVISPTPNV